MKLNRGYDECVASLDKMLADLVESGQENIVRFLRAELDRADKILGVARVMTNDARCSEVLADVGKTIKIVRNLQGNITDQDAWNRIHMRTDEIQRALESAPR